MGLAQLIVFLNLWDDGYPGQPVVTAMIRVAFVALVLWIVLPLLLGRRPSWWVGAAAVFTAAMLAMLFHPGFTRDKLDDGTWLSALLGVWGAGSFAMVRNGFTFGKLRRVNRPFRARSRA
ncbi:MAG TPA: hypothetical protein VF263_18135 [Longimicrobiaceae bacterium]